MSQPMSLRLIQGASLGDDKWASLQLEDGSQEFKDALKEYNQRFVCHKGVPACLGIARARRSPDTFNVLCGGKLFQVR